MNSPSRLDKEDEDYDPIDEDDDDDDYTPGKKKKPKKKKKQANRQKQMVPPSTKFQLVAVLPIEFEPVPTSSVTDTKSESVSSSANLKTESTPNSANSKTETDTTVKNIKSEPNSSVAIAPSKTVEEKSADQNIQEEQEPVKKKPRKMITPQRSRIDFINKKLLENAQKAVNSCSNIINSFTSNTVNTSTTANSSTSSNSVNGSSKPTAVADVKDPLASSDSANNIPKVLINNSVNRFPCGFCDTVFTDKSFLERHHKRCRVKRTAESVTIGGNGNKPNLPLDLSQRSSNTPSSSDRLTYRCDQCPFHTKNPEHLKYHRPIHNSEKYFSCDQCKFSCRSRNQLDVHKKLHPQTITNEIRQPKKPEPAVGESSSATEESEEPNIIRMPIPLKITEDRNDNGVMFTCDQCVFSTSKQNYLAMHKKIHVREMPYQCLDCGYKCSRLAYFRKHRATHGVLDETLISCDLCSFATSSQKVLDAHKICHISV